MRCTTCKWACQDSTWVSDFVCVNDESKWCADWVDGTMVCDLWEDNNGTIQTYGVPKSNGQVASNM